LPKANEVGAKLTTGAGFVPVPVSVTVCGLFAALSAIDSEALRAPAADGVKVRLMVQFAPAASVAPQVCVWEKSVGWVPVNEYPVIVSGELPVFVRVTVLAALAMFSVWLPKASEVGVRVALGAGAVPVPVRAAVCGLPAALSTTDSEAERAPAAAGVNVTLIVQFAPGATLVPQVLL
jgi:hypothetical protein